MKGQISLIEAIVAGIALFIAFNMMITTGEYQTRWKESLNLLYGRDILTTADRMGKLHDYAFSQTLFNNEVRNKIGGIKDSIVKLDTQESVKNKLYIACDCPADKIPYLQNILASVKFNNRIVSADVCSTTLPTVNSCTSSQQYPDILIIWGYKDLQAHVNVLNNLKNNDVKIIEIADIQKSQVDAAQQSIFGLKWLTDNAFPTELQDTIIKPRNTSIITYQVYKWFYHLPYLLTGTTTASIPLDTGTNTCASPHVATTGNFKFQGTNHAFWICDSVSVYFDSNGNNKADIGPLSGGQIFSIGFYNFKLNYIDATDRIRVSIKPDYKFSDFLFRDESYNKLFPVDDDKSKIPLSRGYWDIVKEQPVAAVIFSGTGEPSTAWVADFSRNGLANTGDDHKQLLSSLIFSMSVKTKETFQQIGQITSYIDVSNVDILEIYKIELSIGTPF